MQLPQSINSDAQLFLLPFQSVHLLPLCFFCLHGGDEVHLASRKMVRLLQPTLAASSLRYERQEGLIEANSRENSVQSAGETYHGETCSDP